VRQRPAHPLGEDDAPSGETLAEDADAVQLGLRGRLADDRRARRAVAEEILVRPLDDAGTARRVVVGDHHGAAGERSNPRIRRVDAAVDDGNLHARAGAALPGPLTGNRRGQRRLDVLQRRGVELPRPSRFHRRCLRA
jgi:hypothetical protein